MFQFKKFEVEDANCAMKVGTDAVLLGATTDLSRAPNTILDIGTGSGIIALIIAQRSSATQIDAIEIDETAFEQAVFNFENSPWSDRLYCFHAALNELVEDPDLPYDLIVCNPPFFSEDYLSTDPKRNMARFSKALPPQELLQSVAVLLAPNGVFSVIIPYSEQESLIDLARLVNLFPYKITHLKGNPNSPIKRSLLHFSTQKPPQIELDLLVIETERHQYTQKYIELTKDFYIKM